MSAMEGILKGFVGMVVVEDQVEREPSIDRAC